MGILKLKPACKDYLWGGHRLVDEYGVQYDGDVCAEAWVLSCHPDGPSTIVNGKYAGRTLQQFIDAEGKEVLGTNCRRFREFPILTKFIDAKQNLSIQVHPDNAYALKNENQYGKTEMWYVIDAEPGAFLYYGFKKEISREEFEERIKNNTLTEVLNAVHVKKGDALLIESGTLHAIGSGILIAEIQQNSNVTYRVYDYGRIGKDGKPRELHIAKALDVTKREPAEPKSSYPHIADCDYFTVDKINLNGSTTDKVSGEVGEESFLSILVLDGGGKISCGDDKMDYRKGDSFFLPAGSGKWKMKGSADVLLTTVRAKKNPITIQIKLSSDLAVSPANLTADIHLVKEDGSEAGRKKFVTDGEKGCAGRAVEAALKLLDETKTPLDQCTLMEVSIEDAAIQSHAINKDFDLLENELGRIAKIPVSVKAAE